MSQARKRKTRMTDTALAARIRANFESQTMMQTLGGTFLHAEPGLVRLAAEVAPHLRQQQGVAHGGLVFSLADSAAGYAALTVIPEGREVMTVEMKINMLAPATGRLIAEGRVLRGGKRLVVVAADVWSEDGDTRRHVAVVQGTMIPVDVR